jgi:hypothetical protein
MGASSLIDIIGSFVVAGLLFIMGLQLNAQANETTLVYNGNAILQSNLTTLVDILETDFRRIGYCKDWTKIANPNLSIRIADSDRIRFLTDLTTSAYPYGDGNLDSITYYVGPTSELTSTPNPNDRYLYRRLNNTTPYPINLGVTQFAFKYFDALNNQIPFPVTDPRAVYFMQVSVAIQSAAPYKQEYMNDPSQYDVFWKQIRLVTQNLKNR